MFDSIFEESTSENTPDVKDPFQEKWWDDGSGAILTPWDDTKIWQEEA